MPLFIVRNDITKMKVDAIVNAANNTLLGGGGVDGAIHQAAGPALYHECLTLGGCKTGSAKITKGYNLPAKYIIHTVGPVWHGGIYGEDKLLYSCYTESLAFAKEYNCASIAFPLISTGAYAYPKIDALYVATQAINDFLIKNDDIEVYLVVYDNQSIIVSKELFNNINKYINQKSRKNSESDIVISDIEYGVKNYLKPPTFKFECSDKSFAQELFRLIESKGMTEVECYKKANVTRKVFSRIRSDEEYHPSKPTAVAFAIALKLSLSEAKRLIELAGYSLTHNNKFDIIIEYFIKNGIYDIFKINETLFAFDQKLLGY